MTTTSDTSKKWFKGIAITALIWNLLGVMAYLGQAFTTDEALALLPKEEQDLYTNLPAWYTAAFAFAVFGGAIGSLLLLMKKKLAVTILIISLIGILTQMYYNFFVSKSMEVYGAGAMIMPVMVVIIGVYLVWYAKKAQEKGWLS